MNGYAWTVLVLIGFEIAAQIVMVGKPRRTPNGWHALANIGYWVLIAVLILLAVLM